MQLNHLLRHLDHIHHADERRQRGGLNHPRQQIDHAGQDAAHTLRQQHMAKHLRRAEADGKRRLALVRVDGNQRAAHQIAHLGDAPQTEHQNTDAIRLPMPAKPRGKTEIADIKQHQHRHEADELQIRAAEEAQKAVRQGHQHAEQDAAGERNQHRGQRNGERYPRALQQPPAVGEPGKISAHRPPSVPVAPATAQRQSPAAKYWHSQAPTKTAPHWSCNPGQSAPC